MNQDEPTMHELLEQQHLDNLDREILGEQPPADDQADEATHVQVDPLALAGNLLVGAFEAVDSGNGNDRRLTQKIALGHALAVHAQAAAARMHAQAAQMHAQAAQQQLHLMLEARQLAAGKPGGPAASLVVPTIHLGNGR